MIRVVRFLLAVALVAFGAVWLADRPGEVTIDWLGYRVDSSVAMLLVAVAALALAILATWSLLRGLVRSPGRVAAFVRGRRSERGYQAISRGLIAIGAGDLPAARRFAGEARRFSGDEPLALLLAAQTAQLAGNRSAAEVTFRRMADRGETKLLGLHGLFVEAQRRSDPMAAREVAEEAVRANPAVAWAAEAVLEFRCAQGDWAGALRALDSNMKTGLTDRSSYRRSRAVLLTARALSGGDREAAIADVTEAVRLSPGLVPAAALAGRLLAEAGRSRQAARIIETAWRINPHPDLAETYAHVRTGDSARDRLMRVETLARIRPDDPEGKLAVARAAIDAREFAAARAALAPLVPAPTRRVALMLAEIEERDTGDVGRTREWMARALNAARDPAWTADGLVSDKWLPVSPATGRLDAFQWKVPLADLNPPLAAHLDGAGHLIDEPAPVASVVTEPPHAEPPRPAASPALADEDAPAYDGPVSRASAPSEPAARPASAREEVVLPAVLSPRQRAAPRPPHYADSVIPLVHSPDDPGPDPDLPADPAPVPPERWWRSLFR